MKSLPGKWLIGLVVMGLLIAGLASPFVPCAQGEIRLKKYDQVKNSDSFKNYMNGVGRGYFWSNIYLEAKKLPLLYCEPDNVALRAEDYLNILAAHIEKHRNTYKNDAALEMILLNALIERYPCSEQGKTGRSYF